MYEDPLDAREVCIRFRRLFEKVTEFRHLSEKEQDQLMYDLRSASVDLNTVLNNIQANDKQQRLTEVAEQ